MEQGGGHMAPARTPQLLGQHNPGPCKPHPLAHFWSLRGIHVLCRHIHTQVQEEEEEEFSIGVGGSEAEEEEADKRTFCAVFVVLEETIIILTINNLLVL